MGRIAYIKLRSRKGASITFALLAFLVCAVVSAVLLASASAAAGRLSGLAESDQRYYAVTSAAQLFCDSLKDQEFIIERKHETKVTNRTVYTSLEGGGFDISGPEPFIPPDASVGEYYKNVYSLRMKTPSDANLMPIGTLLNEHNLATDLALYYVFGNISLTGNTEHSENAQSELNDLLKTTFDTKTGHAAVFHMTMEVPDGANMSFLNVDVDLTMREDGQLQLEFVNQGAAKERFTMEVVMMPKIQDDSDHPIVKETETVRNRANPDNENSYWELDTLTTETTKTTTISWTVSEIRKKVS